MYNKKNLLKLFTAAILLLFLTQAWQNWFDFPVTKFHGIKFSVPYQITLAHSLSDTEIKKVESSIEKVFTHIDTTYNRWNPTSELSNLNRNRSTKPIALSIDLYKFLEKTSLVVDLCHSRFDPTIFPLQKLWKKHLEQGKTPPQDQINQLLPSIGWDKITLQHKTCQKADPNIEIDLDGIVKGYTVDLLAESLEKLGYPNILVEWGGEIKAFGRPTIGRQWQIFVSSFGNSDPDEALTTATLNQEAIASSGDYLQSWSVTEVDGTIKNYTHIIDKKTYAPLEIDPNYYVSASVIAPECYIADALATTLMLFPDTKEAEKFAQEVRAKHPEISFFFATGHTPQDPGRSDEKDLTK